MADDWDLYAVVRSCTNAAATSTASPSSTTNFSIAPVENSSIELGESSFLNSPPSDFPGFLNHIGDSFQGLEEIYKEPFESIESCVNTNSLPRHSLSPPSNSALQSIHNPQYTDQIHEQQQIYPQPQQLIQPPQQYSHLSHGMFVGSSLSFPSTSPQPIRPRRRKNQQAKTIRQMTHEELSADSWAWRKYGQKPIKGSPYPRNYYRCSTSKVCIARKQVERCPTDPNMYVVSYSGEHSHHRPAHRSSLAGSTRSKISPATKPTTTTPFPATIIPKSIASCSSSSPASASSFSPTTTLITEGESAAEENAEEAADTENTNNADILPGEDEGDDHEVEGWDDDDDGTLIPNYTLENDDILKGLQFKD